MDPKEIGINVMIGLTRLRMKLLEISIEALKLGVL